MGAPRLETDSIVVPALSSFGETIDRAILIRAGARRFAPIWKRFLAATLDFAIVASAAAPAALLLVWFFEAFHHDLRMTLPHARYLSGIGAVACWVLGDWLYHARQMCSSRQATIGKRVFRLRLSTHTGRPVGFGQATTRHFAKFLSTFLLFIGFMMAAFSRRRQALHDVIAGTIVVED